MWDKYASLDELYARAALRLDDALSNVDSPLQEIHASLARFREDMKRARATVAASNEKRSGDETRG